ncbi:hypothetical protein [Erwinia billingiae]|uniref:hypothetical protein n=1 Tax=Erwinia billingiae TaxID=182337 RepID=UPI003207971B
MSDIPVIFSQKERAARKEYKCCECRQPIKPKEKYIYSFGVWDGSASGYKQCAICAEVFIAAGASEDDPEDGPCFTGLREWMSGYFSSSEERSRSIQRIANDLNMNEEKIKHVIVAGKL